MERPGATTLKGNPLTLIGPEIKAGDKAPDFSAVDNGLQPVTLASTGSAVRVFSVVPSLDTPVCDAQTKRFNEEAAKLAGVEIYTFSMDLPFAQKRWCGFSGVDKVKMVSDHRDGSFGSAYGTLIKELRIHSRAIFVVDKDNTVRHAEYVKEVADHPNYETARHRRDPSPARSHLPGLSELMADARNRVAENVTGEFFVDSSCIDCDTCRQLAPATFADAGDYSFVHAQPADSSRRRDAFRALVACPTASIGAASPAEVRSAAADFPVEIEDRVSYCGFTSEKSFGASSYLVRHADGNWLIDSPRYVEHLARKFDSAGGIRYIFLTHRDDVADAEKWARRFASCRIIHRLELAAQPGAERVIDGTAPVQLAADFLAIPTPGHTRGHCVLLYRDRFLFSGDHLWWSRPKRRLNASRSVCWYSWPQQMASMAVLANYSFEWVLPGHGERVRLSNAEIRRQLAGLVEIMRAA